MPDGDLGTNDFKYDMVAYVLGFRISANLIKIYLLHRFVYEKKIQKKKSLTVTAEPGGNNKNRFFRCKIRWNRSPFGSTLV